MRIDVITIFPAMFTTVFGCGVTGRAVQSGILELNCINLRDFAHDPHRSVDDRPFGGGEGMVFKPEPLARAVRHCRGNDAGTRVVNMSPQGRLFDQQIGQRLAQCEHLLILCGRYEGIDQRIIDHFVDEEVSIGDYVLSGGEIPAMVVIDAVTRLLPGVVGHADSIVNESFAHGVLDYPVYTRPACFEGMPVPDVLLAGDHAKIASWRKERALEKTRQLRPDLYNKLTIKERGDIS